MESANVWFIKEKKMKKQRQLFNGTYEIVLELGKSKKTIVLGTIDGKQLNRYKIASFILRPK